MIKSILATKLENGMVLALPMGRYATVSDVKVGTKFVSFTTEFGKSRIGRYDEILIDVEEEDYDA